LRPVRVGAPQLELFFRLLSCSNQKEKKKKKETRELKLGIALSLNLLNQFH
jgi:hypothetical protein